LQGVRRQSIDTLSKGYFHRTCFAQAILHDPPILILDEPTDGLDPNQKHEMRELIKTMGKTKAIIVSTHILEEVEAICTRAIIIDCGKLVFNGTPAELRSRSAEAGCVTVGLLNVSAAEATPALEKVDGVKTVTLLSEENGRALYRLAGDTGRTGLAASLKAFLDGKHWNFDELHTNQGRLDDVFHTITSTDSAKEVHK
jgi:ABC-2 type transport system ATP-binding protein